jgi:hypothetical protein
MNMAQWCNGIHKENRSTGRQLCLRATLFNTNPQKDLPGIKPGPPCEIHLFPLESNLRLIFSSHI